MSLTCEKNAAMLCTGCGNCQDETPEDAEPVYECFNCGEGIYEGERCSEYDGDWYCNRCIKPHIAGLREAV